MKSIPDNAYCFFMDGGSWCCVRGNFINLQETEAGFGTTMVESLRDLTSIENSKGK